jgi:cytochrome c oxidase subunit II
MSALLPPAERLWWKQPVDRVEWVWIVIAFVWCLIMFFMMPWWHVYGEQNYSGEAYRTTPQDFNARVNEMVAQHTVRRETIRNVPVVRPPAGSDVYLLARLWEWYPILELQKGETYRFRISSADWQHGLSIQPVNINLQVVPGYEMVINITPTETGDFALVCNEYCGILHHAMLGMMYVVDDGNEGI